MFNDVLDTFKVNGTFEQRVADAIHIMNTGTDMVICDAFQLLNVDRGVRHLAVTTAHPRIDPSTIMMVTFRRFLNLETIVLHPWCVINDSVVRAMSPTVRYADLVFEQPVTRPKQFQNEVFSHLVNMEYLKLPRVDDMTSSDILVFMPRLKHLYLDGSLKRNAVNWFGDIPETLDLAVYMNSNS